VRELLDISQLRLCDGSSVRDILLRSLNREAVRTPEVNMAVSNRSDASQGVDGIPWRRALTFTLNRALQALGVPGLLAWPRPSAPWLVEEGRMGDGTRVGTGSEKTRASSRPKYPSMHQNPQLRYPSRRYGGGKKIND
jgi:hypothetical protein